jgi:preprotein translocase subunit SecD
MPDPELARVLRTIGDLGLSDDQQDAERRVLDRLDDTIPAIAGPTRPAPLSRRSWLKAPRHRVMAIAGLVALMVGAAGGASALLSHGSGTRLVYEAVATPQHPVTRASLDQTASVMRERLRGSAPGATVRLAGRQITVSLPGVSPTAPIALEVGSNAGVEFYDWEGSVIDAAGRIAGPSAPSVTGGINAGGANGGVPLYQALTRAVKRPSHSYPTSSTTGGTFYAVQAAHRLVLAGPALTRTQLALQLAHAPAANRASGTVRILHVPVGTTVVSGEASDGLPDRSRTGYYVLNDDPAVVGSDITDPTAAQEMPGGQPSVAFNLTASGQAAFARVTKLLARRGASTTPASGQPNFQHFAIVLDGGLVSVPTVDFRQYPNGIQASGGSEIAGGFTPASARVLASLLAAGPLPVALVLLTRTTAAS